MNKKRCCAACKWRQYENLTQGYVCVNAKSERCADWVRDGDVCEQWEKGQ